LALELAPDAIRVNYLAPVATDTPMLPHFLGHADPSRLGRRSLPASHLADLRSLRTSPTRHSSWHLTLRSSSQAWC
jgi:NAD(P)-dependent dehydrogenase (short-subunit alcohol dehydrogenase family)